MKKLENVNIEYDKRFGKLVVMKNGDFICFLDNLGVSSKKQITDNGYPI